ncbi:MAG: AAA family ATPase [Rickettsiales bacterium]|jgi:predicted ATP-binding protein involved in virulence|nr:AAA family ATPase [Rickettsiales bacterium]
MYLHSLKIKGFRKLADVKIVFSPNTTFLIGSNNAGKTSVLRAIELLLSAKDKLETENFYKTSDEALPCDVVELIGEFRGVDPSVIIDPDWRGFNARRVVKYTDENGVEDYKFTYRRIFNRDGKGEFYMWGLRAMQKAQFSTAKTWQELIDAGIPRERLAAIPEEELSSKFTAKKFGEIAEDLDELWDLGSATYDWYENPGGIPANVVSKLPKFLFIPPYDNVEECGDKRGTLVEILSELFQDARSNSQNYKNAVDALKELEKEFNPDNPTSQMRTMIHELNETISGVFPGASITATANLSCDDVLNPQYNIELASNIKTKSPYQGTGQIRSAVFALLKYKEERDRQLDKVRKDLIIAFEEPELYLHPHAAYLMKEVIYGLSESKGRQIVCPTHSPYMIDLSKQKPQVLNKLSLTQDDQNIESVSAQPFNITKSYTDLIDDEKAYLKMLLKIDDEVAKIFFSKKILIIEGDTEDIVFKQSIGLLNSEEQRNKIMADWTILKARGKPVIISIIKYLKAMGFNDITVMHDEDADKPGAVKFNQPIKDALANDANLIVLPNAIEGVLGYVATTEKPFAAYKKTLEWVRYDDMPAAWRTIIQGIFNITV